VARTSFDGRELSKNQAISVREALRAQTATAQWVGFQEKKLGTLEPGKQADLLVVRSDDINNMPLNDSVGTLVLATDPRNIRAVFVAGQPRKWAGELVGVDVDDLREEVYASRDAIVRRAAAATAAAA
jgi:cytosine/adenosine deaminase-related metal-dependent hydrolase